MLRLGIASGDWIHPRKLNTDTPQWGGSGWARLGQYSSLLPFEVYVGVLTWIVDRFVIVEVDGEVKEVDVVYMQRLMHEGLLTHVPEAIANGQKVINDLDDWYWGLDPSNGAWAPNHPKVNPGENTNHYRGVLARSSAVTVSTPYLADRIKSFVRCPIIVVPNTVDVSRFSFREPTDTHQPLVGWVGSTAHRSRDIETVSGVLKPMALCGQTKLYHGGHHESAPSFASKLGIAEEYVRTEGMRSAKDYPELMQMDIGIVPLSNTPFNKAKSDIKGLEYASAGIPFIAQDLDSYLTLYKTLGIGCIAKRPSDWIKHLKNLSNPSVRQMLASYNREAVQSRDISNGVKQLTDLITSL